MPIVVSMIISQVAKMPGKKLPTNNPVISKINIGTIISGTYKPAKYIKTINTETVINKLNKANLIV
jgi:hypothetical protein